MKFIHKDISKNLVTLLSVGVILATAFLVSGSGLVTAAGFKANSAGTNLSWSHRFSGFSYEKGTYDAARSNGRIARNPVMSIRYRTHIEGAGGTRIACGTEQNPTVVPYGTMVRYVFEDHKYSDFSWSTSGGTWDTPYGIWKEGSFNPRPSNSEFNKRKAVVGQKFRQRNVKAEGTFVALEPEKKMLGGASSANCNTRGNGDYVCTQEITNANGIRARFRLEGIPIKLMLDLNSPGTGPHYVADRKLTGPELKAPAATVDCFLKADESPNGNPAAPSVTVTYDSENDQCVVGLAVNLQIQGNDPDGDLVRYLIDWDNNGTYDEMYPTSGYMAGGSTQVIRHSYSNVGLKTVRVAVEDDRGLMSEPVVRTISCGENLELENLGEGIGAVIYDDLGEGGANGILDGDLTIRAIPAFVGSGSTSFVHWNTEGMTACIVTGSNGDGGSDEWNVLASLSNGVETSPIVEQTIYTLSCVNADGNQFEDTAQVSIIPNWQEF